MVMVSVFGIAKKQWVEHMKANGRQEKCKEKENSYRGGRDTCEGQIKDGMKWGYSKYIRASGEIYEGNMLKI